MIVLASAAFLATKLESLRAAEQRLMEFAARFDHFPGKTYSICPFDTKIPRSVVPIHKHDFDVHDEGGCYRIHGLRVTNDESSTDANKQLVQTPLVFLHGYMNGSAYFYRNFAGLVNYFQCIYSLDLLGWGLSSRPAFRLVDDSVETAEQFFVASLEAWRKQNNIEKMILAGHSMGGYISVAYCERYPEHVERLILISPAGVTQEPETHVEARRRLTERSLKSRLRGTFYTHVFQNFSLGDIIRALPSTKGQKEIHQYVRNRLKSITAVDEQSAIARYLYLNNSLPGSGEYCVSRFLTPTVFGRKPTEHRIPRLNVSHVSFIYGESDWMDATGGLRVQKRCESEIRGKAPQVDVYQVSGAGHLVMLDNWKEFNSAVVLSGGLNPSCMGQTFPKKLCPQRHGNSISKVPVPKLIERMRSLEIPT